MLLFRCCPRFSNFSTKFEDKAYGNDANMQESTITSKEEISQSVTEHFILSQFACLKSGEIFSAVCKTVY